MTEPTWTDWQDRAHAIVLEANNEKWQEQRDRIAAALLEAFSDGRRHEAQQHTVRVWMPSNDVPQGTGLVDEGCVDLLEVE